ncbi:MAG: hypothetical protein ABGW77_02705 [Campylobacterales bacterium]
MKFSKIWKRPPLRKGKGLLLKVAGIVGIGLLAPVGASYPPSPPPLFPPTQIGGDWVHRLKIEGSIDFKRGVPGGSYQIDSWRLEKLPRPGLYLLRLYLVKKLGKFTNAVTKRRLILKVKGSTFAIYDPLSGKVLLYRWKEILKAKPVKGGWEYQWEVPPINVEFSNPDGSYHLKFKLLQ